ncbi:MAG: type II toxin-antitoxin system ParD family antitoxin [Neorhizobium sp.]|nr:type II toxin-antitoxin system ParD family antitoxin [Neorhizobium sp.]
MNEKISISLPANTADDIQSRVDAGLYPSAGDVVSAALRALDREERLDDPLLDMKVREALDDDRPALPADQVFERLERLHAAQMRRK